jgi:hypothetical protein
MRGETSSWKVPVRFIVTASACSRWTNHGGIRPITPWSDQYGLERQGLDWQGLDWQGLDWRRLKPSTQRGGDRSWEASDRWVRLPLFLTHYSSLSAWPAPPNHGVHITGARSREGLSRRSVVPRRTRDHNGPPGLLLSESAFTTLSSPPSAFAPSIILRNRRSPRFGPFGPTVYQKDVPSR